MPVLVHEMEERLKLAFMLQIFFLLGKGTQLMQPENEPNILKIIWKELVFLRRKKNGHETEIYLFSLHPKMIQIFLFSLVKIPPCDKSSVHFGVML